MVSSAFKSGTQKKLLQKSRFLRKSKNLLAPCNITHTQKRIYVLSTSNGDHYSTQRFHEILFFVYFSFSQSLICSTSDTRLRKITSLAIYALYEVYTSQIHSTSAIPSEKRQVQQNCLQHIFFSCVHLEQCLQKSTTLRQKYSSKKFTMASTYPF